MPICPGCAEETSYLLMESSRTTGLKVEGGKLVYDDSVLEEYQRDNWTTYQCPNCGDELVETEEDAIKF